MNIYSTDSVEPYHNLALEESLSSCGGCLFLWQNARTVVIGAGQNAWLECDISRLSADGGTLARRKTGGGAVYHDMGNLNFSFIMPRDIYDVDRQMHVILSALHHLNINAELSGRNDITVDGRKCSGNAFRIADPWALHHGTLLVDTDFDAMARYLTPSRKKTTHRGVNSLPARVCNLSEFADISIFALKSALTLAFSCEYGCDSAILSAPEPPKALIEQYAAWEYVYGRTPQWDALYEHRFSDMTLSLGLTVKNGAIIEAIVNTDALDETLSPRLKHALIGTIYTPDALSIALTNFPEVRDWLIDIMM